MKGLYDIIYRENVTSFTKLISKTAVLIDAKFVTVIIFLNNRLFAWLGFPNKIFLTAICQCF